MRLRYVAPLGLWLVAAALTSLAEGTPDPLPTVALGSTALLHACRAAAPFAIGPSLGTILARAGAGRLPVQLSTSGVAWDAEESRASKAALAELQRQVQNNEEMLERAKVRLDALNRSPNRGGDMADERQSDDTEASWSELKQRNAVSRARVLLAIERLEEIDEAKRLLAIAEAERRRRWRLF